jgi:hypothetical protein
MAGAEGPCPPIDPPRPARGDATTCGSPVRWDEDDDGDGMVALAVSFSLSYPGAVLVKFGLRARFSISSVVFYEKFVDWTGDSVI